MSARQQTKRLLLDTLGCGQAATGTEIGRLVDGTASFFGGPAAASMLGKTGAAPVFSAVYANARLGNALDFDETFPVGAHFGIGAVAAALAASEERAATGVELLTSIAAGYEAGGRVASYIGPVAQIEHGAVKGFPQVWGVAAPVVFAAAAASARASSQSPDTVLQTLAHAGSNAPLPAGAMWSGATDLPNCKYCDAGWCAATGAFAALLAQKGGTGFTTILDGPLGLARMYGVDNADTGLLVRGLGEQWMLDDVTYKPWPTCRFTHYALTALQNIVDRHDLKPEEITRIVLETGPLAASRRFTNPDPVTFASRQFSYPLMAALIVAKRPAGPQWMDPALDADPVIRALKSKVQVVAHANGGEFARRFERNQIREMPGGARVETTRGLFTCESDFALGDPWDAATAMSDKQLAAKFMSLWHGDAGEDIVDAVFNLDRAPNLQALSRLIRVPGRSMETS
jgi:2-methylcitrate dehydratase PrpD